MWHMPVVGILGKNGKNENRKIKLEYYEAKKKYYWIKKTTNVKFKDYRKQLSLHILQKNFFHLLLMLLPLFC